MRAGAPARLAVLGLLALPLPARAAGLADAPPGALSCSGCHAVRAAAETSVPPIHGRPAGEIADAMAAFRAGTRPATVMNRIAPGFSPAETVAIAAWLSRQARP